MARRANSQKGISMKGKLIMIALMFVIINLVFYFGFDSSDESGQNEELDIGMKLNDEIQSDSQDDLLQKTNENLDFP
ncbi:MAG: hypothetical protein MK224_02325 [Candidatus Nitrosopelagicus sp.]|jgi:hypothetical protein|nr:hypothetical protein [Candidatus Nitrosopelagicus sp.]HIA26230.1 hypothetical protein [Candidatus Nitrosopelagicus sp.]HIF52718.1 hypothetical protein [Candidatus Nitrosopelagicus sp.]HIO32441.1 hypothetical protein [Candidatus Nitrosopelagicus sp.]|tara:strand:- start:1138 stop:1368 length:231 start_codon:yes stop_codon:yes gene_type:complete